MSGVNVLAVLDQGRPPSIFQSRSSALNAAAQANISLGFAVVTLRGKIWRLVYQGTDDIVRDPMRPDQPAQTIEVVIVGAAAAVSKQYYAKPFVEGSDAPPDCYSLDGLKPEAGVVKKENPTCGNCPQNQWGSRVTDDGRRAKRCQDAKRLAIVPSGDLENEAYGGPMLLRVPPTSLPNLSLYAGNLARRGAPLEALVTRIGFAPEAAYPQLTFTPVRWLNDEEARLIVGPDGKSGMMTHPTVGRILIDSVAMAAVGGDPEPVEPAGGVQQPEPAAPAQSEPQPAEEPAEVQAAVKAAQDAAIYAAQKQAELEAFNRSRTPEPAAPAADPKVTQMPRRPAAFGGAAAPSQETPPPNGAAAEVSTAPAGMQRQIDAMLAQPIPS